MSVHVAETTEDETEEDKYMCVCCYPQTETDSEEVLGTHFFPHPQTELLPVGHREDGGIVSGAEVRPGWMHIGPSQGLTTGRGHESQETQDQYVN